MPIALLAPEDGADPASGVFRLATSPGDEARAVAHMAAAESFPTVAVLAPRDDVGQEAAEAFVAEANALGLAVTAQGTYDPTDGDLEADIKRFLNLVPATNPRLAEHLAHGGKKAWSTFSPDVPFTLLYIPDRYDRAAIVAAFLPYFNVELRTTEIPDVRKLARKHNGHLPQVVQLVGGAGWHHASLPIRGGDAVQGALIVDTWPGQAGGDAAVQFASAFQARTGRAASSVAAEAFDGATLVAEARARRSAPRPIRAARCAPRSRTPGSTTARAAPPRWAAMASSRASRPCSRCRATTSSPRHSSLRRQVHRGRLRQHRLLGQRHRAAEEHEPRRAILDLVAARPACRSIMIWPSEVC